MPRAATRPAADERYTAAMQAEDRALVGRSWRCLVHGRAAFDAVYWIGDYAYCTQGDCSERLIGVGKAVTLSPEASVWSREYKPPPKKPTRSIAIDEDEDSVADAGPEVEPVAKAEITDGVVDVIALDERESSTEEVSTEADSAVGVDQVDQEAQIESSNEEEPVVNNKGGAGSYGRGELKAKLLATLAAAPGKRMTYDELSEALWPGFDRAVRMSRLSASCAKPRHEGFVATAAGVVTLLIDRPPPEFAQPAAAPRKGRALAKPAPELSREAPPKPRRKHAGVVTRADAITMQAQILERGRMTPADVRASEGRHGQNVNVAALRGEIRAKIEKLQAVLERLDGLDEWLA